MSAGDVKGGAVNRPGAGPEIPKLPTSRCVRCGLVSPAPIVVNGSCRNISACDFRIERTKRRRVQTSAESTR